MATKTVLRPVKINVTTKIEAWDTRFGASARLVTRGDDGKFVTNVSLTSK